MQGEKIRLTKYAHGAGCGCKIAPQVLEEILAGDNKSEEFEYLLVGNDTRDDAAVFQLNERDALIATTDFFTPIVDDPYTFGKVAAANAISDIYAMGGTPLLALSILGWPINTLPVSAAKNVIKGATEMCSEAGIPIAGGHSIETTEPVFGLSVNGKVMIKHLKENNKAKFGDKLFLTKPIGIGVLSTAMKRGILIPQDYEKLIEVLTGLNKIGEELGKLEGVHAMTDVTGFGLAGHLIEMAENSGLSAVLEYSKVPKLEGLGKYLAANVIPDATYRNWNGYSAKIKLGPEINKLEAFQLLPDPQTNGGLLISVQPEFENDVKALLSKNGYEDFLEPIGRFKEKGSHVIEVE